MAREWSRRSIEEIARKIGSGLGGKDKIIGAYASQYLDYNPIYVEGSQFPEFETGDYKYLAKPILNVGKIYDNIRLDNDAYDDYDDSILLGIYPYHFRVDTSSEVRLRLDINGYSDSFSPFIGSTGVIRNNAWYYVAFASGYPGDVSYINFDDYTRAELDLWVSNSFGTIQLETTGTQYFSIGSRCLWLTGSRRDDIKNILTNYESVSLTVFPQEGV